MPLCKRLKIAAVAALMTAVPPGCVQTPQVHQADSDRRSKIEKFGHSNLVNARSLVIKFCLRGGPFDASPQDSSGPFGFVRVDALDLTWNDTSKLVVEDIATGEGGWWRIAFSLGPDAQHTFLINPGTRVAACGGAALANLRATFRPDHAALQGDELAAQVYGFRRGGFVEDVSDQPDDIVCGLAVLQPHGIWETNSGYRPYVEEAQERGYTPESCVALTAG